MCEEQEGDARTENTHQRTHTETLNQRLDAIYFLRTEPHSINYNKHSNDPPPLVYFKYQNYHFDITPTEYYEERARRAKQIFFFKNLFQ